MKLKIEKLASQAKSFEISTIIMHFRSIFPLFLQFGVAQCTAPWQRTNVPVNLNFKSKTLKKAED